MALKHYNICDSFKAKTCANTGLELEASQLCKSTIQTVDFQVMMDLYVNTFCF